MRKISNFDTKLIPILYWEYDVHDMKMILSLTDFSAPAANASRYAFELAKVIKANIILCNAIKIPLSQPVPGGMVWPMDFDKLLEETRTELDSYAGALTELNQLSGASYPKVTVRTDVGDVLDLVREISLTNKVNLIAMGLSGAGEMSRFFLGSCSRDMIDTAQIPLLLIPKEVRFKMLTKIAFATDLSAGDILPIQALCSLAAVFNAELLIVHITLKESGPGEEGRVEDFMARLKTNVNFDNIYYKSVYSPDVEQGLEWLSEHGQIDCLAMVHRPHDFLSGIIKGSHSQKMARISELPLIIFPQDYHSVIC